MNPILDRAGFGLFVGAAAVLLVTPGPAVLYIVARSLHQGRLAGVVSSLGIAAGTLCHVLAAAAGLSALLRSSPALFGALRYLGAAYLVYLGSRHLTIPTRWNARDPRGSDPYRRIFTQGMIVNLLNPKTILFLFAFLPQFVSPARGSPAAQIALLGATFALMGVVSDSAWALAAGSAGNWMKGRPWLARMQRVLSGGVLVALGLLAALSGAGATSESFDPDAR